jgi:hypothetical protein
MGSSSLVVFRSLCVVAVVVDVDDDDDDRADGGE